MGFLESQSHGVRLVLSAFAVLIGYALWFSFSNGLNKYPGPSLAKWTNLWRLYHVSRGSFHLVLERLHDKYGPVVRIGPNVVDVDAPEAVKTVFNTKGDWKKTEHYHASSVVHENQVVYNLFSQTDPQKHAAEKRPIAKYYSMNGVQPLEPHMDTVIKELCHQLETRFMDGPDAKGTCALGQWILFYTWDVVGKVTFSQTIGYLGHGRDFDGTLGVAEQALDYFSWVGCIPVLDHFLAKNPYIKGLGPPGLGNIGAMSVQRLVARYQGLDKDTHDPEQADFLDKFIDAKNANPGTVDDAQIVSWLMINLIAGADTTAISIRSTIYFSLRNPRIWRRLRDELAAAGLTKDSSDTN